MAAAVSAVGASWGNQCTLVDNFMEGQSRVLSYPALPPAPTWSTISRIALPAGRTCRAGSYKKWESVSLCFDIGCGNTTPVADVTEIQMSVLQIMNSIRSIELRCQEQSLFLLEQGNLRMDAKYHKKVFT